MIDIFEILENEKKAVLQKTKKGIYRRTHLPYKSYILLIIGLINLSFGIILLFFYTNINALLIPYTTGINNTQLIIKKPGTYKMYVQINQLYQSYLYYSKSISTEQIQGEATFDVSKCAPLEKIDGKIIYPCGLIANSFLQDTFEIEGKEISVKNISWPSELNNIKDTEYNFDEVIAPPLWETYTQLPNLSKNERFANWITIAPFPNFRKLYGIVKLEKGVYNLKIDSTYPFGNTSVYLTETCWAGVRNFFLAICCIIVGFILVLGFGIATWINKRQ